MFRGFSKRGISPVVASVLLIMIAVVTATLIAVFLIPFVQNRLGEGKGCFEILGDASFYDTPYSCYSETEELTGFSVSINSDKINGFVLLAIKKGTSDRISIINGSTNQKLKMLGDDNNGFGNEIVLPENGGVRTYVYNGTVDSLELYPILDDGTQCDKNDQLEPNQCTNTDIITCLNTGTC